MRFKAKDEGEAPPAAKVWRLRTHLDVDPLFGFFAIKQAFDVKVGTAGVLLDGRTDALALARDDDVGIDSWRERQGEVRRGDRQLLLLLPRAHLRWSLDPADLQLSARGPE